MAKRKLVVEIVGDDRSLTRALGRSQSKLGGFGTYAKRAGMAAAAGFGAGVAASVKVAADFEEQLSALGSVADANAKQMKAFREQALQAGADTKYSAMQAAQAQTELAKGGLSVENIMKGGLKAALALAAAGDLELADAAAYTANAMNLFGLEGKATIKVADGLATAANATTADVSDFGLALTQGGGAAKSAGMSFQQTMLALEALAQSGVKGSDAGTSLKAALVQLAGPTAKQADLADELGLKFFDAEGKMKPLAQVSDMLRDRLGKMGDQQRLATLKTLAGTDGFRALLAVYDQGPAKLNKLERGLAKQGSAAEVAAKRQDNLKGKVEQLQGSIETAGIVIGSALIPPLTDAAGAAADFIGEMAMGKGQGGEFVTTVQNLGGAAAPAAIALGNAALAVGKLGLDFAQTEAAIVLAGAAVGALTGRMVALGVAFAAGKIIPFAAAIVRTISVLQSAIAVSGGLRTAMILLTASTRGLTVAMASTGIGALAIVAGTAIGALMGFKQSSDDATVSQQQFRDAILGVRNALDTYRDADDRVEEARLAARASALAVKEAEDALREGRGRGAGGTELERLELNLAQARQQAKRDAQAATDEERDLRKEREKARGEAAGDLGKARQLAAQSNEEVRNLRDARSQLEKYTQSHIPIQGAKEKLHEVTSRLPAAERRAIAETLEFRREQLRFAKVTGQSRDRIEALRDEIRKLKSKKVNVDVVPSFDADKLKFEFEGALASIDGTIAGIPFQRPRGGKRNREGGWAFQAGGLVPSILSPGEVGILPNGSSFTVPGTRVAADTVPMMLPQGTAVLTDHGQQLMASGASIGEAISWQMPHFREGGVVQRFAAGGLAGATTAASSLAGAGVRDPRQLVVMTATAGRESRWNPKAKGGPNTNGTYDHGFLQANDIWASKMGKLWGQRYTWDGGGEIAKRIADAQGPSAWRLSGWNADSTISEFMGTAQRAVKRARAGKGFSFTKVTQPKVTKPLLGNMLAPLTDNALVGGIEAGRTGASRLPLLTETLEGIVPQAEDRLTRERVSVSGSARGGPRGGFKPGGGWGGTKNLVMQAIAGHGQSATFKRSVAINGNQNSDHNTWIKNAYAADISPGGDGLFNRIARRLDIPAQKGSWNSFTGKPLDGFRSQLLWHAPDGSHKDHVHLGIRAMRRGGFVVPPSAEVASHAARMRAGGKVPAFRSVRGQRDFLARIWADAAPQFGMAPDSPLPFSKVRHGNARWMTQPGYVENAGEEGKGKGELWWPDWLWQKDGNRLRRNDLAQLAFHEIAHRFQDPKATASAWEAEGGAELWARHMMRRSGRKVGSSGSYGGYVRRVSKQHDQGWLMSGQFQQMRAGGVVASAARKRRVVDGYHWTPYNMAEAKEAQGFHVRMVKSTKGETRRHHQHWLEKYNGWIARRTKKPKPDPAVDVGARFPRVVRAGSGGVIGRRLKVGQRIGGKDGRRRFDDNSGVLVRSGKVVRAFSTVPKDWRKLPVSPIPPPTGLRGLVDQLGGSPGTDGADALVRRISTELPDARFGQLRRAEVMAKRQIRSMAKQGFTGSERIQARRLRGAISLLQDEQGRRIGAPLGRSDFFQDAIARNETNLPNHMALRGIEPESLRGLEIQKEVAGHSLRSLGGRQRQNQKALRLAKRTGDKEAIATAQAEVDEVADQMLGLKASLKDFDDQIKERTGPRGQANRDLALASLTADTEDDRQALTKLRDIAAQQLEEAKRVGDPQAIADAANDLKGAVDALAAATPRAEDFASRDLAMASLTERLDDDKSAIQTLIGLAEQQLAAALQTADPRDDIDAANNLKGLRDQLKSLDETIAQQNEIAKQREDFEKERLEVDKEIVRLTKTQGPAILAATIAAAEGWIGGKVTAAGRVPQTAGVPAGYRG
jgi:TP901 family phage tail tape measure protein